MTLVLDESLQSELEEIQVLLGKKYSKLDLLRILAKEKLAALKRDLNKKSKLESKSEFSDSSHITIDTDQQSDLNLIQNNQITDPPEKCTAQPAPAKSRYIPKNTLRELKIRDQQECQYIDPKTGRQCSARFLLQVEHIQPFAKGGSNQIENLQLLCANHNRLRAVQQYSEKKMSAHLPNLNL